MSGNGSIADYQLTQPRGYAADSSCKDMGTLLDMVTLSDVLRAVLQHISPCAWRSDRHLTLNRGQGITGVTLPFNVNLSYPGLKQLFYINITWEVTVGGRLPFKSF